MVIITETKIINSIPLNFKDESFLFTILNILKIDIFSKYPNLKKIYNLNYNLHSGAYLSITYTFHTENPSEKIFKSHRKNCPNPQICRVIVDIPQYSKIKVVAKSENIIIKKYPEYKILNTVEAERKKYSLK